MSNPIKDAHIVVRCLAGWSSREIAKEFGVSRQAIAKHIERLRPVIDLETRAIVRRIAVSQSRQLGLLPPPRPKPRTVQDIVDRPSPAQIVQGIFDAVGADKAAQVSKLLSRRLKQRRYRMRLKARAKAVESAMHAFSKSQT